MKSLFICPSIFLSIFLLSVLLSVSAPVAAQTPQAAPKAASKNSVLNYDVYAGGIHAMKAQLNISQSAGKYDVTLVAATQGMLKRLADWSGKFESKGNISGGKTYPISHESSSVWKGGVQSKQFKYDGKGGFLSYKMAEDGIDKTPKDLDLSLAKDTTDTLSATLQLMRAMPKNKVCAGNELVFDGDRNYRLVYKDTQIENLQKTNYNIFTGEAIACSVEVIPEKGKWRKKPRGWLSIQEQGRATGSLPTVWFGPVKGQPDLYAPVKIRIKTAYGTLFMHLTSEKTS